MENTFPVSETQTFSIFLKQSKRSTRLRFIALVYHQWIRAMGRDLPFDICYEQLALQGGSMVTMREGHISFDEPSANKD